MNRKQTQAALIRIAESIARPHGLDIISVHDSDNGLWDKTDFTGLHESMGEIFARKYGGKLQETMFTAVPPEEYDLRKDFKVEVGYRFSNPRIEVGTQWGSGGFTAITFSPRDKENDLDYQMSDAQIFKESGVKYYRTVMSYWHQIRKEYGEDPLDWKEDED